MNNDSDNHNFSSLSVEQLIDRNEVAIARLSANIDRDLVEQRKFREDMTNQFDSLKADLSQVAEHLETSAPKKK